MNSRVFKLLTVSSGLNVADAHTKCLSGKAFRNYRGKIMSGFGGDPDNIHRFIDEYP